MVIGLENIPMIHIDDRLRIDGEYTQRLLGEIKEHYSKADTYKGKKIVVRTQYFIGIAYPNYIKCFSWQDIMLEIMEKKRKAQV